MMTEKDDERRAVLAVYCRRPVLERVKTRLAAGVGHLAARRFYSGCLESLRQDLRHLRQTYDITICPSDGRDADWARDFFYMRDHVISQVLGGLGPRLEHTDMMLRDQGYDRVIFIGSDAPSLPLQYILDIDRDFSRAEVVLGPCIDGGVYAIASRVPLLPLGDVLWGTGAVYTQLIEKFRSRGMRVATLSTWYDVDRPCDLEKVYGDLVRSPLAHRRRLGALVGVILRSTKGNEDDERDGWTYLSDIGTRPLERNGGGE